MKEKKKKSTKTFKHYEPRISKMIHRFILEAIVVMRLNFLLVTSH